MGVTFKFAMSSFKEIEFSEEIKDVVLKMQSNEIKERPSIDFLLNSFYQYSKKKNFSFDILTSIDKGEVFVQPWYCDKVERLKLKFQK
jgi:hypothetical protein